MLAVPLGLGRVAEEGASGSSPGMEPSEHLRSPLLGLKDLLLYSSRQLQLNHGLIQHWASLKCIHGPLATQNSLYTLSFFVLALCWLPFSSM